MDPDEAEERLRALVVQIAARHPDETDYQRAVRFSAWIGADPDLRVAQRVFLASLPDLEERRRRAKASLPS